MKKNIILSIFILIIIISIGLLYYLKIYMNDRNVLSRYLQEHEYACVQKTCTKKNKEYKYNFDLKDKELYISNNKYRLTIGENAPVLSFKNGNKQCIYNVDNYKRGDKIKWNLSYDYDCKEYIEEINKFIDEYNKILKDNNM